MNVTRHHMHRNAVLITCSWQNNVGARKPSGKGLKLVWYFSEILKKTVNAAINSEQHFVYLNS